MAVKIIQIKITPPPTWFIYIVLCGLISVLPVGSMQLFVGIYLYEFVVPYNLKLNVTNLCGVCSSKVQFFEGLI